MKPGCIASIVSLTLSAVIPVPATAWIPAGTSTSTTSTPGARRNHQRSNYHRFESIHYQTKDDEDTRSKSNTRNDANTNTNTNTNAYDFTRPKFSQTFRKHMEDVKGNFPANEKEGVDCTGEPSMDPSRMVMDDGLDSEYLSDCK